MYQITVMAFVNAEKILKNIHIFQEIAFIVPPHIIRPLLCSMMSGNFIERIATCRTVTIGTVAIITVHTVTMITRM